MAIPGGTIVHALFRPHRAIGPIEAMCVIEEGHFDEMAITDHPVEQGARISDHAYLLPVELRVRAGWSKSPNFTAAGLESLLGAGRNLVAGVAGSGIYSAIVGPGGSLDYTQAVYAQLRGLMLSRTPMDIYTGKRLYQNMLIRGLSTETTAATENALIVDIECRQVLIARTETRPVAAPENQRNPERTGGQAGRGTVQTYPVNLGTLG